ncbi:unnamed protein product [Malus baccata var. baccata]
MGRSVSNHSEESLVGEHGSPHRRRSPSRKIPSRIERSPTRHRREKHSSHPKSPKHARSPSHPGRSPSPRTKRLRRAQAEREAEREPEKNNGRGADRDLQKEGGSVRDVGSNRKERRSGRDDTSPSDQQRRSRHRSSSPQPAGDTRGEEKVIEKERERNHGRGSVRSMQREKGSDRETESDRVERKSGKDSAEHRSSRSRHGRSTSPLDRHHKNRHRSHSPQQAANIRIRDEVSVTSTSKHLISFFNPPINSYQGEPNSRGAEQGLSARILMSVNLGVDFDERLVAFLGRDAENDAVAMMKAAEEALEAKQKQKPSFELSGKLAAETNRVNGVTLLFTEPPEGRKPTVRWRLYVFKGGEVLKDPLYIHRQSCYLFGRERRVADIPTDHPSCSKQHAVIQYRQVEKEQPDGMLTKEVRPYLMDLGSTNKTFLNELVLTFALPLQENAIEPQRYYELMEKDTIKFGNSSREYVLLHENSMD